MRTVNRTFDLQKCLSGLPVRTLSGKNATFIMIQRDLSGDVRSSIPAPLTMAIGGSMESYTKGGRHITDSSLDLYCPDPIDWGIDSPSNTLMPLENFEKRNCLNKGFMPRSETNGFK